MLPNHWRDFVFPDHLREHPLWIDQFAKNRRFYLTGYAQAARHVDYRLSEDVHTDRSKIFAEDPRRCIPFEGWRNHFRDHGEIFVEGEYYAVPPEEPLRQKCTRWGAYGKDQPEHAWGYRPMRLFDALKSIVLLYDKASRLGQNVDFHPQGDEFTHTPPGIGIHVAIFRLAGFDQKYYDKNLRNEHDLLISLFRECRLIPDFHGQPIVTFEEMARGMSASHRTCQSLQNFLRKNNMPKVGDIIPDLTTRGTNRRHRQEVKKEIRTGFFEKYSADCAIEVFTI
jgi:hypothetical protein